MRSNGRVMFRPWSVARPLAGVLITSVSVQERRVLNLPLIVHLYASQGLRVAHDITSRSGYSTWPTEHTWQPSPSLWPLPLPLGERKRERKKVATLPLPPLATHHQQIRILPVQDIDILATIGYGWKSNI